MSIISSSQSNSHNAKALEKKAGATKERSPSPEPATTPMYTENADHIGRCCASHWHTHAVKTAPEISDGWSGTPSMSPAPLRVPSDKTSNPLISRPQDPPLDLSSEYSFPLPPASMAKPRARLPPPYSSLVPSISTASAKDTTSANNGAVVVKNSTHTVRRTQSITGVQKSVQCKPLPAQPLIDVSKKEQEEVKRWKPKIFRSTPASTKYPSKGPNSTGYVGRVADATSDKEVPPSTATLPKESALPASMTKMEAQLREEKEKQLGRAEEPKTSQQSGTDESWSENNPSMGRSEAEARSSQEKRRLTSEQILWLHRNYRGEATFLKAWGLHITREADREHGLEIMRELMAAELPKEKERIKQDRPQKQRDQQARLQFKAPQIHTPRDKEGLHAIEEEGNGYE
ncbi:hypothetical protein F5Y13DRAFT_198360 [Hypoxylon sp. FL1857]|nr:hypothetical protein F5Y13DRAFT_198360 [Hypoxylon sp. FL1857]